MSDTKVMNRWIVVVGAILVQLCLGAIYAWSVFTPALNANDSADVVSIYGAEQLGLSEASYIELSGKLIPLKKDLKAADKEIRKLLKSDPPVSTSSIEILEMKKIELGNQIESIGKNSEVSSRIDELKCGWTKTQTQMVFSAGLALFAIVMVIAGRMMPKVGPRKLAIAGGLVLGAGYLLAGLFGGTSFWPIFIFVGIIGGSGIGLAYVVPIAVGMRWFPDKKGLITGLAVAGFGFGATIWVKMAGAWGHMIENMGLSNTFIVYGIVFAVAVILGGLVMVFPPKDWLPAGYTPPKASASGPAVAGTVDYDSGAMLKTPQFYMIFLTFLFSAGAGLMSIGLMKLFPSQALEASGMDAATASATAGTAMAVFFSLANGIGRIAWGAMSDKLGRKRSVVIMTATQGILVILFPYMAGKAALLYLGATLVGFNFGGNFALFPTTTADTFGTKFVGQNYGWVFLAYGVGGILGPIMGGRLGDLNNFPLAFTIAGVACLVAAVIAVSTKPPKAA